MDLDILELLRGFERLASVLIGGFTIYLGYRLFSVTPKDKSSAGTVTLPGGFKINLSRVGPGAFFALFGGILLGIALLSPVRKEITTTSGDGSISTVRFDAVPDSLEIIR
jgi:hypothetical protein